MANTFGGVVVTYELSNSQLTEFNYVQLYQSFYKQLSNETSTTLEFRNLRLLVHRSA